jgi:hypothetical protein
MVHNVYLCSRECKHAITTRLSIDAGLPNGSQYAHSLYGVGGALHVGPGKIEVHIPVRYMM